MLDEHGGTLVLGLQPRQIRFNRGREVLRCLSLTPQGLLRWYAGCCGTAIGNTMRSRRFAYVGMIHTCLAASPAAVEGSFGPVRMLGFRKQATRPPPRRAQGTSTAALGLLAALLIGTYKITPFFTASGEPVVPPRVLSAAQLERARAGRPADPESV
jgi:hypothetical protein